MQWFNFWFYFLVGMSTALDTLCSQSFGAGDMRAYWTAAASSLVMLSIMAVPMAVGAFRIDRLGPSVVPNVVHAMPTVGDKKWRLPGFLCFCIHPFPHTGWYIQGKVMWHSGWRQLGAVPGGAWQR